MNLEKDVKDVIILVKIKGSYYQLAIDSDYAKIGLIAIANSQGGGLKVYDKKIPLSFKK